MIDRFFLTHPELRLNWYKASLSDLPFSSLETLTKEEWSIPDEDFLSDSNYIQVHERYFLSELDWALNGVDGLTYFERLLVEAVILHKLQMVYFRLGDDRPQRQTRSMVALGAIVHQRLNLLLLQVSPHQYSQIFSIGKLPNLDVAEWEKAFVGSSSYVRAVQAFATIKDCRVFLSTLHEFVDKGISFLVTNMKTDRGMCVNVKSGEPEGRFYTEHVHTKPDNDDPGITANRRRRVFNGTEDFNINNGRNLSAVRIIVGRPNGGSYDMTPYKEDSERVGMLIERLFLDDESSTRVA